MDAENTLPEAKSKEFEEITIPVPGGHIAGCWYGNRDVRPILALHGWLDNYCTWDNLIPLMPPHIGVLAIDMAGHGKSFRRPEGRLYDGFSYVVDIIRVMEHYNWDKVSIMAHSMSCAVSFVFAAFYPNRVDMLIQMDYFLPPIQLPEYPISRLSFSIEKFLLEEKRIRETEFIEPPSYPHEEVVRRVHEGSNKSVDIDKCDRLIRTNVIRSTLYPAKYYFSRDPRAKYLLGFLFCSEVDVLIAMAKRIQIPQLVIKASASNSIDEHDPLIEVIRNINPYFEFHILQGTHHVHLNNAPETSVLVNTFLNKWKPSADVGIPVDGATPQPQICPTKPQGRRLQNSKL